MSDNKYKIVRGKATASNGAATAAVIAAPGAGKAICITWGTITVPVAAVGAGGLVSLKDGTTVILSYQAGTADSHYLELGDDGYQLTANSALNLVVEGAATTQATAFAVITGYTVG